jgi:glutaminyl-peptide cyclotransferase
MKLSRWIIVLPVICACQSGEAQHKFSGAMALRYAATQVAFGPRVPGTPPWQKAGDWIVAQMRQRADTVIEQRWTHPLANGGSIPMRNILARFRPKATDRILYVTHWDTRPIADGETDPAKRKLPIPGADDGASGVGLFVALGDVLKGATLPSNVGVDLLFVDGEDYGSFDKMTDVLIGSTYFAQHLPSPDYHPIFGVLWDMIGQKDLLLYEEQNSLQLAPEVVSRVWQAAAAAGYSDVFISEPKYSITDDHMPLLSAGLRVVDVIDLDYPYHHKLSDTIDQVSPKSLGIVGAVATALIFTQP